MDQLAKDGRDMQFGANTISISNFSVHHTSMILSLTHNFVGYWLLSVLMPILLAAHKRSSQKSPVATVSSSFSFLSPSMDESTFMDDDCVESSTLKYVISKANWQV